MQCLWMRPVKKWSTIPNIVSSFPNILNPNKQYKRSRILLSRPLFTMIRRILKIHLYDYTTCTKNKMKCLSDILTAGRLECTCIRLCQKYFGKKFQRCIFGPTCRMSNYVKKNCWCQGLIFFHSMLLAQRQLKQNQEKNDQNT